MADFIPQPPSNPQPFQPGGPQQPRPQLSSGEIINGVVNQVRTIINQLREESISKISRDVRELPTKIDDVKSAVIALGMTLGETSPVSKPSKTVALSSASFYIPTFILFSIAITIASGFYILITNFKTYYDQDVPDKGVVDSMLNGSMVFFGGITLSIILIFAMLIYIINSL
jgi:hypothetical protein